MATPQLSSMSFSNFPFFYHPFWLSPFTETPYDYSILSTQIGYSSFRFVSPNDEVMVTLVVVVGMGTPKRKTMRSEPESSAPFMEADADLWLDNVNHGLINHGLLIRVVFPQ